MTKKEELLEKLDAAVHKSIASWQDIYNMLSAVYALATEQPSMLALSISLVWHRAFARAMELLPEEGDALKIALKMNRVMIEELMVEPDQAAMDEVANDVLRALQSIAREAAAQEEAGEGPAAPVTPPTKRVLH